MANLEFYDKHNMVAYLKKPTGSEGFQEIVDFLNDSHKRCALTKNPTIYVSLIEKFWQTATVRTVDNGEQEITATVDGKEFTVTEASVRRHLQLSDAEGISVLPTTEIFDQLSLIGYVLTDDKLTFQKEDGEGLGNPFEPQSPPSTAQPTNEEPILNTSVPIPNVPDEAIYEEWDDRVERATTTTASLDAKQASGGSPGCQEATGGSIAQTRSERVPTPPHDSPLLRVNTLGSDEGIMQLQELMALCTKLSDRVLALETDLRQTKKVYGTAYTKLIMKVKKLEKIAKSNQARRRAKIVVSDDEEDSSKQGRMIEYIDQDARITLVTPTKVTKKNVNTYTRRRRAVSTGSGRVSTVSRLFSTAEESVSTVGASMPVSTAGMYRISTKGQKTKPNWTKLSTDLERAEKSKSKPTKSTPTKGSNLHPLSTKPLYAMLAIHTYDLGIEGAGSKNSGSKAGLRVKIGYLFPLTAKAQLAQCKEA
ncbi:hypothetical protein Tco_0071669 [Tanacetum coccineum]